MESQSQNPEFRINPENHALCRGYWVTFCVLHVHMSYFVHCNITCTCIHG